MKDKKDKIYYFQEKSNDILDLQDELNAEEIGIYFILKAGYFKYAGELKKENANQRCKFFGDMNKFNSMILKLFDEVDGLLINNSWLSEIKGIKALSEKRKEVAEARWKQNESKPTISKDSIDKNNNILVDFQELWKNYPVQIARVKGSEKKSQKKYNSLRKNGTTKEELSKALECYKKELKTDTWRRSKRVEGWLDEDWEAYKQKDYSKEIEAISTRVKEIEPLASILVKDQRIIINMPSFKSLTANQNSIENDIKQHCKAIGFQYSFTNQQPQND